MKDEWKIEIQESEQLLKVHGILCMVNTKGEKLYVKPISHKNGFIELAPLTIQELKDLSIDVQESCVNAEFDIEVQGSTEFSNEEVQKRFEEEQRKKSQKIPLNTVEDATKMREIAEKAKEILERKTPNPEELREENEDLRAKLEMIASKELESRMNLLKLDEETKKAIRENPERLKGFMLAKNYYDVESGSGTPAGSAPLNDYQVGRNTQSFSSEKEMIDYLRKNKTPENEAILRKLFERTIQGMVDRKSWEIPFENANPKSKPESDSNVKAVEVNILAPKDPNQESELKKFGVGVSKKRRDD